MLLLKFLPFFSRDNMTLIEYTFIRFFYLRRKTSGITPSERAKAVFFISILDITWLQILTIIVDLLFAHVMFKNFHITLGVILIGALMSIIGREVQLGRLKTFSKIDKQYRNLNHKKWNTISNIYIVGTFVVYITCCVLLYHTD